MFVAKSGSTSYMVNSQENMTNLQEVRTVIKTVNKKTMMGFLNENCKGYQKINGKFYPVTCTNTEHIPYLSAILSE